MQIAVYADFLNNEFTANHISFFVQTKQVIEQVCTGEFDPDALLSTLYVKVDKVVIVVDAIFKNSSAMALFEGTSMYEVPQAQL